MATKKVVMTSKENKWELVLANLEDLSNYAESLNALKEDLREYTSYNADELTVFEIQEMEKLFKEFDMEIAHFDPKNTYDDLSNLKNELEDKKTELEPLG
jgi:hypothetical protein